MRTPYTYLIGWSQHQKFYYGVRYAKGCNPNELWATYFTSSKYVKHFRELYGEPDIIQVRKSFNSVESARLWETTVLKRTRAKDSNKWLNKTDNISIHDSEEIRLKKSISLLGTKHTEKRKKAISEAKKGVKNPWTDERRVRNKKRCEKYWTEERRSEYKQYGGRNSVAVEYDGLAFDTIRECSKYAGVSTGMIHHWFKTGQAIRL